MKFFQALETWIRSRGLSSFILRAAGMSFSAVIAQAIALGNLTLVSRFFGLDMVGHYYVFSSYAAILGGVVLLGYHLILPHLEQQDFEALTQALFLILLMAGMSIYGGFTVAGYAYALPLAFYAVSAGLLALCLMVNIRFQNFRLMTSSAVVNPVFFTLWLLLHLSSGKRYPEVLIFGQTLSISLTALIYTGFSLRKTGMRWQGWRHCLDICLRKYRQPFFVMPATLLNTLTYNLPVILIERFFGANWAACYGVVLRFCFGPVGILGNGLSSAYHSEMAKIIRDSLPNGLQRYYQVRRLLGIGGLGLGLALLVLFPTFISLLLGDAWRDAGWMVQLLSPLFACMLAYSPLTVAIYIFEKQKVDFVFESVYSVVSLLAFGIGILTQQLWLGILLFSLFASLRYLLIDRYCHHLVLQALGRQNHPEQSPVNPVNKA